MSSICLSVPVPWNDSHPLVFLHRVSSSRLLSFSLVTPPYTWMCKVHDEPSREFVWCTSRGGGQFVNTYTWSTYSNRQRHLRNLDHTCILSTQTSRVGITREHTYVLRPQTTNNAWIYTLSNSFVSYTYQLSIIRLWEINLVSFSQWFYFKQNSHSYPRNKLPQVKGQSLD